MIITDINTKCIKVIQPAHIQMIDEIPTGNEEYPWEYAVWTDTFVTRFKSNKIVKPHSLVDVAIDVHTENHLQTMLNR
jgi:hypothetical protein